MAELHSESRQHVDLSLEGEVLSWSYGGSLPIEVVARIDLGTEDRPLAGGGGPYQANMYLNTVGVAPVGDVMVAPGRTRAIVVSKPVAVRPGDVIALRVVGRPDDVDVDTFATLRDVTPAKLSELVGDGAVQVDHNYGGADNLAYQESGGRGIVGADIRVFLKSDYDAGRRANGYVVARTGTTTGGRWAAPLMLDHGAYVLVCYAAGRFGPDTAEITV